MTEGLHAQVIPACIVPAIGNFLDPDGLNIHPKELVRWNRSRHLNEEQRDQLAREFVAKARTRGTGVWKVPSGIVVPENWKEVLDAEERARARQVLDALGTLDWRAAPLAKIKASAAWPFPKVMRLLAKLEAMAWDPTTALVSKGGSPLALELQDDDLDFGLTLPWIDSISRSDLRFAVGSGPSLREHLQRAKQLGPSAARSWSIAGGLVRRARMTVAEEIQDVAMHARSHVRQRHHDPNDKWVQIFVMRFTGATSAGRTLEEVGQHFGLTRERVRQICQQMIDNLVECDLYLPALERVLSAAKRLAPASVLEINEQLEPHFGVDCGIQSALEFAKQLGREIPELDVESGHRWLGRERVRYRNIAMGSGSEQLSTMVMDAVLPQVRTMGCTTVQRVAGTIALTHQLAPSLEDLVAMLKGIEGFRWVGAPTDSGAWFTVGSGGVSSMFARRVEKLLASATDPVSVDHIANCVSGDDQWSYRDASDSDMSIPPTIVLSSVVRGWDWIECLQHTRFRAKPGTCDLSVLAESERIAYDTVLANGGVATSSDFNIAMREKLGLSRMRIAQILSSTPILLRLEQSIYCLRARRIDGLALEEARKRMSQQRSEMALRKVPGAGQA